MAVEVICPECGGVIGATDIDEFGRSPCTCAKEDSFRDYARRQTEREEAVNEADSSDTVSLPAQSGVGNGEPPQTEPQPRRPRLDALISTDDDDTPQQAATPAQSSGSRVAKICIACGKDTTGHRRVKDSRGYMCLPCAKAEISLQKAGTVPCPRCRRRLKEGGMIDYRGERICRSCFNAIKESEEEAVKVVDTKHFDEHERRNLYILLAIFSVLLLIVVWRTSIVLLH